MNRTAKLSLRGSSTRDAGGFVLLQGAAGSFERGARRLAANHLGMGDAAPEAALRTRGLLRGRAPPPSHRFLRRDYDQRVRGPAYPRWRTPAYQLNIYETTQVSARAPPPVWPSSPTPTTSLPAPSRKRPSRTAGWRDRWLRGGSISTAETMAQLCRSPRNDRVLSAAPSACNRPQRCAAIDGKRGAQSGDAIPQGTLR